MKQLILIIALIGLLVSCHYEKPDYYKGDSYVRIWVEYFSGNAGYVPEYPLNTAGGLIHESVNANRLRDTAWFRIQAFGHSSSTDRKIKIEQYFEENDEYEAAVAGINYVAFDDPEMEKYMVIPADSTTIEVPVIMTYDPNVRGVTYHLYFQLVPTDDFEVMASKHTRGQVFVDNN